MAALYAATSTVKAVNQRWRWLRGRTRQVVDALLAAHADITTKDKDGMTALMAAAAANRATVLPALLSHGAEVNGANPDGATALMAAAFGGHVEAAQVLLGAGANVNVKDTSGRPMAAALGGNAALARAAGPQSGFERGDSGGSTALTPPPPTVISSSSICS